MLSWEHIICQLVILKNKIPQAFSICCMLSTEQRFTHVFFFNTHGDPIVPILQRLKEIKLFGTQPFYTKGDEISISVTMEIT